MSHRLIAAPLCPNIKTLVYFELFRNFSFISIFAGFDIDYPANSACTKLSHYRGPWSLDNEDNERGRHTNTILREKYQ